MNTTIILKKIIYIAVVMIFASSFFTACSDKPALDLINDPIEGDLYEVQLGEDEYVVYWLVKAETDSITFKIMDTIVDSKEGLKDYIQQHQDNRYANKRGLYKSGSITLSKKEIKEDLKNGKILNVNRMTRFRKIK